MKDKLEKTFKDRRKEFDFAEPRIGHFDRFEAKLRAGVSKKERKRTPRYWIAVAASFLLIAGYWMGNYNTQKSLDLADVSPKMKETQFFYTSTIQKEIDLINSRKTTDNQKIINDAFAQIKKLETDYKSLTLELKESSEDKRVIYAMISNFQKRLEVLQNLMNQLEELENYRTEKRV